MRLEQLAENPDGSADFSISDMTEEEVQSFVRLGIVKAMEDAMEDAKKYDPALAPKPKKKKWIGLSEGEIRLIAEENTTSENGYAIWSNSRGITKAVEAKLKAKNT